MQQTRERHSSLAFSFDRNLFKLLATAFAGLAFAALLIATRSSTTLAEGFTLSLTLVATFLMAAPTLYDEEYAPATLAAYMGAVISAAAITVFFWGRSPLLTMVLMPALGVVNAAIVTVMLKVTPK